MNIWDYDQKSGRAQLVTADLVLIDEFRKNTLDDIVIYTGYTEEELLHGASTLKLPKGYYDLVCSYENIIIKFGRFKPDQPSHYDEVLGVNLSSPNQYGKIVSKEND